MAETYSLAPEERSAKSAATATATAVAGPRQPLAPPEEQFWVRYSPHHEFPLSSISSVALHVLIIALLFLAAWVAVKLGWSKTNEGASVDAVALDEPLGGGGGAASGAPGGKGSDLEPPTVENVPRDANRDPNTPPSVKELELPPDIDPIDIAKLPTPDGTRVIPDAEVMKALGAIGEDARKKMFNGLRSQGQGGQGQGGGKDKGVGSDKGPGTGPGDSTKTMTQRQKRVLRWVMIFSTRDGRDYADQLAAFGAQLAIPSPRNPRDFLLIEDLTQRPVRTHIADLKKITSIFWVDEKPESVRGLAIALGLQPIPPAVVAFFPRAFEEELVKLEHDFKGLREDQIFKTEFEVVQGGPRGYVPRVKAQVPIGGR